MAVVLVACRAETIAPSPPTSTTESQSSAFPSSGPSSPSPAFPAVELPPDSLIRLGAEVDVHGMPTGPPVGTIERGTELRVVAGPREVDGATWYQVRFPPNAQASRIEWVRLHDPAAVAIVEGACPDSNQEALRMYGWDRLTCFGDSPLTVTGQVGHCQGGVVFAEPAWLAYGCWGIGDGAGGGMYLHAAPGTGIALPGDAVQARVTGHFDDPASLSCIAREDTGMTEVWRLPSPTEQILLCREAFVVDEFEILD